MTSIRPSTIVAHRFRERSAPSFSGAVLIFRDRFASSLVTSELACRPAEQKLLYGTDVHATHWLTVGDRRVVVVEQLIGGGPQVAILVEELAVLGVEKVLGLGACGALHGGLKKGETVFDTEARLTDGTSRAYSSGDRIRPRPATEALLLDRGLRPVRSATVDSLYQETDENLEPFRRDGLDIVNRESAPFLAVARHHGLDAVWVGCVSDLLVRGCWDDWFDTRGATVRSARAVSGLLKPFFHAS